MNEALNRVKISVEQNAKALGLDDPKGVSNADQTLSELRDCALVWKLDPTNKDFCDGMAFAISEVLGQTAVLTMTGNLNVAIHARFTEMALSAFALREAANAPDEAPADYLTDD